MRSNANTRQILECRVIGTDNLSVTCSGGGGDNQIVCAARPTLPPDMDEKLSMGISCCNVVVENWKSFKDVLDECQTGSSTLPP